MDEKLQNLPKIADEMLSDVQAGSVLKAKILENAGKKQPVPFRPMRAIPALCCAVVVLLGVVVGVPSFVKNNQRTAVIESQPAGMPTAPVSTLRADIPSGSLNVSRGADVPAYRSIWARASGAYFPLVQLNGCTYRLLTSPSDLSSSKLGNSLGTVSAYTSEPSLAPGGIVSNTVLEGESVYEINHLEGAIAAKVDGKMRVFQRVSFGDSALIGQETLLDTLGSGSVSELTLSGVGKITDEAKAQALYDTLCANASYQSASCQETSQALLVKFSNGVTLQLSVSGEKVMGCGTFACPEFFEAFSTSL